MKTKTLVEITLLGKNKDKQAIIHKLQALGVIHIDKASTKEKAFTQDKVLTGLDAVSKQLLDLTFIRDQTNLKYDYELQRLPSYDELQEEAEMFIEKYGSYIKQEVANTKELKEQLAHAKSQKRIIESIPASVTQHMTGKNQLVYLSDKSLLFPDIRKKVRFVLRKTRTEQGYYYVFTTKKDSLEKLKKLLQETPLKRQHVSFIDQTPKKAVELLDVRIQAFERDLEESERRIQEKFYLEKMKLPYLITALENYREQFMISTNFITTKNFFAIKGYCEEKDVKKITTAFKEATVMVNNAAINAPTKLSSGKLGKHFQMITELFGLPSYGSIDPTPLVIFFYPFFFGFMLSDIGYGILLFLIVASLRLAIGKKMQSIYVIVALSSLSSVIFGFLFGSFFGNLVHVEPLLVDAFDASFGILKASLIIGLIHLNIGAALNVYQLKNKGLHWFNLLKKGGSFFLVELLVLLLVFGAIIPGIIIGLLLLFIIIKEKGPFGLMDITGYIGTLFSYARLLALSLATAGVALAINIIADKTLSLGKIGIILWVIVIILGHLFNFAVNILGCAIHAARLHYVEFFSFFFEAEGRKFIPFKIKKSMEE